MSRFSVIPKYLKSYLGPDKPYKFDIDAYADCLSDNVSGSLVNLSSFGTNKHFSSKAELIKFIKKRNGLMDIQMLRVISLPTFPDSALKSRFDKDHGIAKLLEEIAKSPHDEYDKSILYRTGFFKYVNHGDCLTCMLTLSTKAITNEGKTRIITDHQSYRVREKIEFVSHHWISIDF